MKRPAIAVVGKEHKDNLEQTIPLPGSKYYEDYDEFVVKTTSTPG